jgi:hypothetical protein
MEIRGRPVGLVVCLDIERRFVRADEECVVGDKVDVLLSQGYRPFVFNLKEVTLMDRSCSISRRSPLWTRRGSRR